MKSEADIKEALSNLSTIVAESEYYRKSGMDALIVISDAISELMIRRTHRIREINTTDENTSTH